MVSMNDLLERINELARKKKTSALTDEEIVEQAALREQYRQLFRASFSAHLENIDFIDEDGNKVDVKKQK
jgi:uncharacterized protein YnzC (UPF0291/DUF896 family)